MLHLFIILKNTLIYLIGYIINENVYFLIFSLNCFHHIEIHRTMCARIYTRKKKMLKTISS